MTVQQMIDVLLNCPPNDVIKFSDETNITFLIRNNKYKDTIFLDDDNHLDYDDNYHVIWRHSDEG